MATSLSKSITWHISLGNYENVEVSASATVDDIDEVGGLDKADVYLDTIVKQVCAGDLAEFSNVSQESKSVVYRLPDDRF